ncbi:MAG: hypothetical protein JSS91_08925 [Bacteroidetes bacterium]|nr:hypothetical protein [Bacteroidota bacterium]
MEDFFSRFADNFNLKTDGPMSLRFIIQPLVSLFFAVKAGIRNSKRGDTPYLWGLIFEKGKRRDLVKEGWMDIGKLFIMALILDMAAQIIILKTVYPIEAIVTAVLLAVIPYMLINGPVNRIVSYFKNKKLK